MINLKYNKADVAQIMELPIEFMDQLIEELFTVIDDDITKLKEALSLDDQDKIKFVLHSIKGAVANLRMDLIVNQIEIYEKEIELNIIFNSDRYERLIDLIASYKKILL